MKTQKTILVSALNWGIGHATRDIPIIDRLLTKGHRVILASDGSALNVWKKFYPEVETVELPSWNIKYQKWGSFTLMMASRAPYILKAIREERKKVQEIIEQYQIDGIISDNRFGVHSNDIPTVFITHQVSLKMAPLLRWSEPLMNYFNHKYIKQFDEVWIPDFKESPNLSGDLSHQHFPNKNTKFVGPVSRFMDINKADYPKEEYDVAICLSGVEPQRTILEDKLIEQLIHTDLKVFLIQGKSSLNNDDELRPGFRRKSFMKSEELMETFLKSKYIVCRSGYSTILDLAVLKQTALMIPTPGQTEQEYLAKWMGDEGLIVNQSQSKIDIQQAMKDLENAKGFHFKDNDGSLLDTAIDNFIAKL